MCVKLGIYVDILNIIAFTFQNVTYYHRHFAIVLAA